MSELNSLWEIHQEARWPEGLGAYEGELMTLEAAIGGCIRHALLENGLDPGRQEIIKGCLSDLDDILQELNQDAREYVDRLRRLAVLILEIKASPS